jgi:hypothetical protein
MQRRLRPAPYGLFSFAVAAAGIIRSRMSSENEYCHVIAWDVGDVWEQAVEENVCGERESSRTQEDTA